MDNRSSEVVIDPRSGYCSSNGIFYSKRPRIPIPENLDLLSFLLFGTRRNNLHEAAGDAAVALIDAPTGSSVSYRKLEYLIGALATGLSTVVGVRQGDVVVLLLANCIEFPVCFLALTWLGAVVTPLNPVNTAHELRKQIDFAGAKYIITSADLLEKVKGAQLPTVIVGNVDSVQKHSIFRYTDLLETGLPTVARAESKQSDTVSILFSSGTTGRSKGVALTHRSYIAAVSGQAASDGGEHLTRMCTALPMYHAYGFCVCILTPLCRGISVTVLRKFHVPSLLAAVDKYRITHMCSVPPMVKALLNAAAAEEEDGVSKYELRSWVQLACGAAPLGLETINAFNNKFPNVKFKQEYGMTETSACVSSLEAGDKEHAESSGPLVANWEAMVLDLTTNKPVSVSQLGELLVRGPGIMKEYIKDGKATEEAIDKNGWLRTGDLVKFDEDGCLYIVDRLKELIKYNGYQVAPAELEDILSSHPEVLDCAIIPYPDKKSGQIPMACLVRRGGSKVTADDIMQWVAKQVAPYKKVRKVAFIETVPKSASGKILHRELVNVMTPKSKL